MKYSYFPGCTLKTTGKELDRTARLAALALGFELEEIDNWQCCGGVYPLGSDEIATKLSSVRALNSAKEKGQDLVTLCSACHHVIKRVNDDMQNVEDIRTRANNYMKLDVPYEGETDVLHFLEVLRDKVGFDELKKKKKHVDTVDLMVQINGILGEYILIEQTPKDKDFAKRFDISKIDFDLLRKEFAKAQKKNLLIKDLDELIQVRLAGMMKENPKRVDY